MEELGRLDIGTLMICTAIASSLFSYAFFRLWGTHRSLRGSGAFALTFLLASVINILIPVTAPTNHLVTVVLTILVDTLALILYAFLLTGIELFFGIRRLIPLAWLLLLLALCLNVYFTAFHDSVFDRLLVNGIFNFLYRLLLGVELLCHTPRKHLRALAALMLLFAAISLAGIRDIAAHSDPHTWQQWLDSRGTAGLGIFLQFVFILATGQLLFLLLNGELLKQVEIEATRDHLTGTLNRRAIERALIGEMGRSTRFAQPLAISLVDIDGFKQINDRFGHAEGDRALIAVSRSIEHTLRAYDTAGRFGGDEFLIILPNSTAPEALGVMELLRSAAAQSSSESVTLSIGVTSMLPNESPTELLARADRALYLAKQDGRNCTRVSLPPPAGFAPMQAPLDLA
jgi:diguanylate cyclase (GGDEF)-like protein